MTYLQLDIQVRALEQFRSYIIEHAARNQSNQFNQNGKVELEQTEMLIELYKTERDRLNTCKK